MNNTTVMSVLGGRETFLQYSTHKEVMKWASMRMFVDLKVSADEMQPCRAVPCTTSLNNADLCCSAYGLPSEVSSSHPPLMTRLRVSGYQQQILVQG